MSLQLYRRHTKDCSAEEWDKTFRKCRCPILAEGMLSGKWVRKSTRQTTCEKATQLVERWEREHSALAVSVVDEATTLDHAMDCWKRDWEDRNLTPGTQQKYTTVLNQLGRFADSKGIIYVVQFTTELCREFRQSWKDSPYSSGKKLKTLKLFFQFCQENKWIEENPSLVLKPPKVGAIPTMPFTQEEFYLLLKGVEGFSDSRARNTRLRVLMLVLRWTGLRIGDAIELTPFRVRDEKVFLYTAKTGTPVWCPIPPEVHQQLAALPLFGEYWFWPKRKASSKLIGMVTAYGEMLRELGKTLNLPRVHAHRFRDTFAVELLQAGASLEDVSVLLGHTSIRTTERHYAPWVKSRQDRLEEEVRKTWTKLSAGSIDNNQTLGIS